MGGPSVTIASSDGYRSWKVREDVGNDYAVSFADAKHGWLAGQSGIYATTDGGTDWVPQITHSQYEAFGVSAVDPSHCWAVGDGGTILARYSAPPDTTPPVTTCSGADALWHRSAVTLTLTRPTTLAARG